MTIPIRPGPFSFLAQLGQAGGEAVASARKEEDRLKKEAMDRLTTMIKLRSEGYIQPDAFGTPKAKAIYQRLGIIPVSDQPTSGEISEQDRKLFMQPDRPAVPVALQHMLGVTGGLMPDATMPATGPSAVSDARRMLAKLPTRAEEGVAKVQGDVFSGGTAPQQRQVAGVQSPDVAAANEQSDVSKARLGEAEQYKQEAEQYVAQALIGQDPEKMGVNKAVETAYQLYLHSLPADRAPMAPDVARRYFAGAVQDRIDFLRNQRIAAMRAANAGQTMNDPELYNLNMQIDNTTNEISRLDAEMKSLEGKMLGGLTYGRTDPRQKPTFDNYDRIQAQRDQLKQTLRDLQSSYELRMQGKFNRGSNVTDALTERRRDWDAAAAEAKRMGYTPEQIEQMGGKRP